MIETEFTEVERPPIQTMEPGMGAIAQNTQCSAQTDSCSTDYGHLAPSQPDSLNNVSTVLNSSLPSAEDIEVGQETIAAGKSYAGSPNNRTKGVLPYSSKPPKSCPKSSSSPERSRRYVRSGMTPRANDLCLNRIQRRPASAHGGQPSRHKIESTYDAKTHQDTGVHVQRVDCSPGDYSSIGNVSGYLTTEVVSGSHPRKTSTQFRELDARARRWRSSEKLDFSPRTRRQSFSSPSSDDSSKGEIERRDALPEITDRACSEVSCVPYCEVSRSFQDENSPDLSYDSSPRSDRSRRDSVADARKIVQSDDEEESSTIAAHVFQRYVTSDPFVVHTEDIPTDSEGKITSITQTIHSPESVLEKDDVTEHQEIEPSADVKSAWSEETIVESRHSKIIDYWATTSQVKRRTQSVPKSKSTWRLQAAKARESIASLLSFTKPREKDSSRALFEGNATNHSSLCRSSPCLNHIKGHGELDLAVSPEAQENVNKRNAHATRIGSLSKLKQTHTSSPELFGHGSGTDIQQDNLANSTSSQSSFREENITDSPISGSGVLNDTVRSLSQGHDELHFRISSKNPDSGDDTSLDDVFAPSSISSSLQNVSSTSNIQTSYERDQAKPVGPILSSVALEQESKTYIQTSIGDEDVVVSSEELDEAVSHSEPENSSAIPAINIVCSEDPSSIDSTDNDFIAKKNIIPECPGLSRSSHTFSASVKRTLSSVRKHLDSKKVTRQANGNSASLESGSSSPETVTETDDITSVQSLPNETPDITNSAIGNSNSDSLIEKEVPLVLAEPGMTSTNDEFSNCGIPTKPVLHKFKTTVYDSEKTHDGDLVEVEENESILETQKAFDLDISGGSRNTETCATKESFEQQTLLAGDHDANISPQVMVDKETLETVDNDEVCSPCEENQNYEENKEHLHPPGRQRSDSISSIDSEFSIKSSRSEAKGRREKSRRVQSLLCNELFKKHLAKHAGILERRVFGSHKRGMRKSLSNFDLSTTQSLDMGNVVNELLSGNDINNNSDHNNDENSEAKHIGDDHQSARRTSISRSVSLYDRHNSIQVSSSCQEFASHRPRHGNRVLKKAATSMSLRGKPSNVESEAPEHSEETNQTPAGATDSPHQRRRMYIPSFREFKSQRTPRDSSQGKDSESSEREMAPDHFSDIYVIEEDDVDCKVITSPTLELSATTISDMCSGDQLMVDDTTQNKIPVFQHPDITITPDDVPFFAALDTSKLPLHRSKSSTGMKAALLKEDTFTSSHASSSPDLTALQKPQSLALGKFSESSTREPPMGPSSKSCRDLSSKTEKTPNTQIPIDHPAIVKPIDITEALLEEKSQSVLARPVLYRRSVSLNVLNKSKPHTLNCGHSTPETNSSRDCHENTTKCSSQNSQNESSQPGNEVPNFPPPNETAANVPSIVTGPQGDREADMFDSEELDSASQHSSFALGDRQSPISVESVDRLSPPNVALVGSLGFVIDQEKDVLLQTSHNDTDQMLSGVSDVDCIEETQKQPDTPPAVDASSCFLVSESTSQRNISSSGSSDTSVTPTPNSDMTSELSDDVANSDSFSNAELTPQRRSPTSSNSDSDQSNKTAVLRSTSDVSALTSDERERRRRDRKDRPYKSDPFSGTHQLPHHHLSPDTGPYKSPSVSTSCSFPSLEELGEYSDSVCDNEDEDEESRKRRHRLSNLSNVSSASEDSGVSGHTVVQEVGAEVVGGEATSQKHQRAVCCECAAYSSTNKTPLD
ncbi:uncharacterized protein LOC106010980, partial [Aplysia californica]|uniref:Uncharacterized protein LOC106010980 n=1 Tax=Aplysia californica TaxID=6500 RepID=A0ABM0ZVR8_APLCA